MDNQSSLQLRILEQLATYKFLCLSQFYLLWATESSKTLYDNLASLRERKLCAKTTYRYAPKYGRPEDVHYLKPRGKKLLMHLLWYEEDSINMPIGKVNMIEQYVHRRMIVTIHIKMRMACVTHWAEMKFFDGDFEQRKSSKSNRKEGATKISTGTSYLRSDAIFLVLYQASPHLFCVEMHNQYRVAKIVSQLKPYAYALAAWTPSIKYGISKSARVLVVFEKLSTMKSTLEIVSADSFYLYMKDYFLFKTYGDLLVAPLDRRVNLNWEQVSLFPSSK